MVVDGESALCFPPGDAAMLAEKVRFMFMQNEFASKISVNSRIVAQKRYLKEAITSDMLTIYQQISS
jgi:glycosyltransferase involved in cell wall biosynthesis